MDASGGTDFMDITFQINPPPNLYSFSAATFTTGDGGQSRSGGSLQGFRNAVGQPAWTGSYLNMGTNGWQRWTVPQTATYRIRAAASVTSGGGYGAIIESDHALTQGEVVGIICGHPGTRCCTSGGGGGGSFVYRENGTVLLVAAGGGGGTYGGGVDSNVMYGNFATNGKSSSTGESGGSNGGGGQGGQQCSGYGGGGGGWNGNGSNGQNCGDTYGRWRGESFTGGGTCNNTTGGFGGGAGTHGNSGGGGGGGGYSGGGGQGHCGTGSGGGGSYSATAQSNIGHNGGAGYVTITRL